MVSSSHPTVFVFPAPIDISISPRFTKVKKIQGLQKLSSIKSLEIKNTKTRECAMKPSEMDSMSNYRQNSIDRQNR